MLSLRELIPPALRLGQNSIWGPALHPQACVHQVSRPSQDDVWRTRISSLHNDEVTFAAHQLIADMVWFWWNIALPCAGEAAAAATGVSGSAPVAATAATAATEARPARLAGRGATLEPAEKLAKVNSFAMARSRTDRPPRHRPKVTAIHAPAEVEICPEGFLTLHDAQQQRRAPTPPPAAPPSSWRLFEDRPGKPGWIANATGGRPEDELLLPLELGSRALLVVGFLTTYENAGRVTLRVDPAAGGGCTPHGLGRKAYKHERLIECGKQQNALAVLDALDPSIHHSPVVVHSFTMAGFPAGEATLRVALAPQTPAEHGRRGANRFKLTLVASC